MENFERTLSMNSLKFYSKINSYFSKFQDVKLLEQHYLQKSKMNTLRNNIHVPAKNTKLAVRCPRCCMSRKQNNSEYKISPAAKRYRFLNRIEKKIEQKKLTKYQLNYIKKKRKYFGNQLVIRCKICQTEAKEALEKPNRRREYITPQIQTSIPSKKELLKPQVESHIQSSNNKKPILSLTALKHNKKRDKRNNKRNNIQIDKLSKLLNTSHKVKSTNLKDFIKSVT